MSQVDVETELQDLAKFLGGGWRFDHGFLPIVTLTINEARDLVTAIRQAADANK